MILLRTHTTPTRFYKKFFFIMSILVITGTLTSPLAARAAKPSEHSKKEKAEHAHEKDLSLSAKSTSVTTNEPSHSSTVRTLFDSASAPPAPAPAPLHFMDTAPPATPASLEIPDPTPKPAPNPPTPEVPIMPPNPSVPVTNTPSVYTSPQEPNPATADTLSNNQTRTPLPNTNQRTPTPRPIRRTQSVLTKLTDSKPTLIPTDYKLWQGGTALKSWYEFTEPLSKTTTRNGKLAGIALLLSGAALYTIGSLKQRSIRILTTPTPSLSTSSA